MGSPSIDYLGNENPETFRRRWNNKEFVGARIASRRKELGLTQTQVAEYFGVSREWVSLIESGRGECNAGDLAVWGKLLDIDPAFFLDRMLWHHPKSDLSTSPEANRDLGLLLHYYSGLTLTLQSALVDAAKGLYEAAHYLFMPSVRLPVENEKELLPPLPSVLNEEVAPSLRVPSDEEVDRVAK